MKTLNRLLVLLFAFGLCLELSAQTVRWEYKPEYDEIRRMTPDLYMLRTERQITMQKNHDTKIRATGNVVTRFENGYAIILNEEAGDAGSQYRLIGIISESDYSYYEPNQTDFYVDAYPFFSDDRLAVYRMVGGERKYGFVDPRGRLCVDVKYAGVTPFSGGAAFANEPKKGKDKWTTINVDGGKGRAKGLKLESVQALYAERSSLSGCIPDITRSGDMTPDEAIVLVEENGLYGYQAAEGGAWVAPVQFEKAEPFSGGCAVVMTGHGNYGVLSVVDGTVNCLQEAGGLTPTGMQNTSFTVMLPDAYKDKTVYLRCRFADKEKDAESRSVSLPIVDEATPTVRQINEMTVDPAEKDVEIICENLVISRHHFAECIPEDLDAVKIGLSAAKVRAGSNDKAKVTVTVTNLSEETLILSAYASGKNVALSRSKLTVKPRASQSFVVTFSNILSSQSRSVTVSGETDKKVKVKAKSASVQLTPFL